jgi:ATP-dependent DNA helicase RecQ
MVAGILRGAKNEKIRASRCDTLSTYGIMADTDLHRIRLVMDHLIAEGYLGLEGSEYPVLALRPRYREAIEEEKTIRIMLPEEKEKRAGGGGWNEEGRSADARKPGAAARQEKYPHGMTDSGQRDGGVEGLRADSLEEALFVRLKDLRTSLARESGVPAYIVFSDASLRDMCRKRPRTREQLLNVTGVGTVKRERYGDAFLEAIRDFGQAGQD